MGIKLSSWNIFLSVLALALAHGAKARKLTRIGRDEVDPIINWIFPKQLDHDTPKELLPKVDTSDEKTKNEPVDDAHFWIYSKQGGHQNQEQEQGEDGSKKEMIKQVTTPTNPMDDHSIFSPKQNNHDHQEKVHMQLRDIPSNNVFLTPGDLKVGKRMKVYFPDKDISTSPKFLPKEEADYIPFSSSQLPYLLRLFSIPKDSPQAKAIEGTLSMCEIEPIKGETKICATSLESMIDFACSVFGPGTQLRTLTNKPLTGRIRPLQNYTILDDPKEIKSPKMVGCHTMPYPYAIFYCHSQEGHQVKVFQVLLGGDDGESMLAGVVCHMDTSHWDRDHVSFRMLGIKPGTAPVCHFFPPDNIVWLPVTA